MLSNGRDETMVCLDTQPSSVREVKNNRPRRSHPVSNPFGAVGGN